LKPARSQKEFHGIESHIKWSRHLGERYLEHATKCYDAGYYIPSHDVIQDYHLGKFLEKIFAYERTTKYKAKDSLIRCLLEGPSYAKICKDRFLIGFLNRFSIDIVEEEYGYMDGYDSIFPYDHLIHWEEDDPEDIKVSFYRKIPKKEALKNFELCLIKLLEGIEVKAVPDELIKLEGGTSVCDNKEKIRGYHKIKDRSLIYSDKLIGRRAIVPVCPAGYRDTFVLTAESINSVVKISKLLQQIVVKLKASGMLSTVEQEDRRQEIAESRILRKGFGSYNRDFKKEGLTKPHEIIEIIANVLENKFPNIGFKLIHCLKNLEIRTEKDFMNFKKGDILPIQRGHGLGMGNELTTLTGCVIDYMVKQFTGLDDKDIKTEIWNDDFRASGLIENLQTYKNMDLKVCEDLGLEVHPKKTRILMRAGVFLEDYVAPESYSTDKTIRLILNIVEARYCVNIVHAKEFIRGLVDPSILEENDLVFMEFKKTKEYWGFEFYPDEAYLPKEFGGWLHYKWYWHNLAFVVNNAPKMSVERAYRAQKAELTDVKQKLLPRFKPEKFLPMKLNSCKVDLTQRSLSKYADYLLWNTRDIANQMWLGLSRKYTQTEYYINLERERKKEYRKKLNFIPNLIELWNFVAKNNLSQTYALPDGTYKLRRGGYTVEQVKVKIPLFINSQRDFYRSLQQECKLIYNKSSLLDDEWLYLLYNSTYIPNTSDFESETVRKRVIPDELFEYELDHTTCQSFYLEFRNGIPEQINKKLEIPSIIKELNIPSTVLKRKEEIDKVYPLNLNWREAVLLEKIIDKFCLDKVLFYKHYSDFKEEVEKNGKKLKLDLKDRLEDCFEIERTQEVEVLPTLEFEFTPIMEEKIEFKNIEDDIGDVKFNEYDGRVDQIENWIDESDIPQEIEEILFLEDGLTLDSEED
jgi:hypothetical protein